MEAARTLAAIIATGLSLATAGQARAATAPVVSVDAYRGAGSWVDIYSSAALARPEAVVARLKAQGVRTLYLETANFRQRPNVDIVWTAATTRFLDAAHANAIRVVAWYYPGLTNLGLDLRRSLAAVNFRTPQGQAFDSLALDIESTLIAPGPRRNSALLALSRALRARVGGSYPLGAIIPDARSTAPSRSLWPGFPYRGISPLFNVFLPMAYSTLRVHGPDAIFDYTRFNVGYVRARTLRPAAPVHPIAGLANGINAAEARAAVNGARASRALGTSFYNYRLTGPEDFAALRLLG